MTAIVWSARAQDVYLKYIEERIEDLKEGLGGGNAENYDQYRYLTGKISGLREALDLLEAAANTAYEQENR